MKHWERKIHKKKCLGFLNRQDLFIGAEIKSWKGDELSQERFPIAKDCPRPRINSSPLFRSLIRFFSLLLWLVYLFFFWIMMSYFQYTDINIKPAESFNVNIRSINVRWKVFCFCPFKRRLCIYKQLCTCLY